MNHAGLEGINQMELGGRALDVDDFEPGNGIWARKGCGIRGVCGDGVNWDRDKVTLGNDLRGVFEMVAEGCEKGGLKSSVSGDLGCDAGDGDLSGDGDFCCEWRDFENGW